MPGAVFGQDLSDANLFRRVRRGDARSFGVLLHRHDPSLRTLAVRLLAEPDQVDPVLLKAYTRAWRSAAMARLGSAKGDSVATWLYRMVYNTCVDELRRQPAHPGPETPIGPRVRLPRAPAERRVSALRALDAAERIPLVLVDGEGFDVGAVARILQRKPADVAADLASARRRWRDLVIGPPEPAAVAAGNGSKPKALESGSSPEEGAEPASSRPRELPRAQPGGVVAHAEEGAFDGTRGSRLRRWFKGKSSSEREGLDLRTDDDRETPGAVPNGEESMPTAPMGLVEGAPASGEVRILDTAPDSGVETSEQEPSDEDQDVRVEEAAGPSEDVRIVRDDGDSAESSATDRDPPDRSEEEAKTPGKDDGDGRGVEGDAIDTTDDEVSASADRGSDP